ncbi:MAG TPA: PAS domain S-box protein [Actinomycetes bacterium]|nr:PAS domain S-box protein [Actinomycetes bacterium]
MTHAGLRALAIRLGRAVALFDLAFLVVWVAAPEALDVLLGGLQPTAPTTCLALTLLGAAVGWPTLPVAVRRALVFGVTVLAVEGALSAVLQAPLLTAPALTPDAWERTVAGDPVRMAPSSAVGLLLVVASHQLRRVRRRAAALAGLFAIGGSYLVALGHLYGVSGLYTFQTATTMAVPTVIALALCAAAVLAQDADLPVPRVLLAPGIAGSLVRTQLGWTLFAPPVVAGALVQAVRRDWVEPAFGLSVMALAAAAGGALLVVMGARTALRTDRAREQAVFDLEILNAELEERVAASVAEAEDGREQLRLLLERTPVGIFETAPDGVRRFANRRWLEIAGLSAEEAEGADWSQVVHPDDREWVGREWAAAIAAGREWSGRFRYLRPDGEVSWVDVAAVAVRDAGGEVTRWHGSVTDVTDMVLSQSRLAESEQRYRSVVATMAEGVVLQDPAGRIVTANEAACSLLGLSMDDLMGRASVDPRWRAVREDGTDLPGEEQPAMVALRTGQPVRGVTMAVDRGDGAQVWLSVSSAPLRDAEAGPADTETGRITGVVTTFADITAQRLTTAALRRSEEQFRAAMAHAPIGMALVELDGRFREVNAAFCRIVGYSADELVGGTFQRITHPEDLDADLDNVARLIAGTQEHYAMDKRYITAQGGVVWVRLAVSLARDVDDRPAYFVAQVQDVTDSRAAQELLEHRALHDPLTGLPNRDLLMDHLSHALLRSSRDGSTTAVMFCDLDRFKEVNDTHGHETGDALLVAVADRLRRTLRPGDTVARLGGDEFVVVAEGVPDDRAARDLAERVRGALDGPIRVSSLELRTGLSVGIAIARPGDDARSVLGQADAAMYRAKALGRGRVEGVALPGRAPSPVAPLERHPA